MWNPFKPKPHPLLEKAGEVLSQLRAFYYAIQDIAFALTEIQEVLDDLLILMGQLTSESKGTSNKTYSTSSTGSPSLPVFDEWALLQSVVRTRFEKDPKKKKMGDVGTAIDYIWEGLPPKYRSQLGEREGAVRDTIRGLYLAMSSIEETPSDEPSKETDT